jgi:hypothetical protein
LCRWRHPSLRFDSGTVDGAIGGRQLQLEEDHREPVYVIHRSGSKAPHPNGVETLAKDAREMRDENHLRPGGPSLPPADSDDERIDRVKG